MDADQQKLPAELLNYVALLAGHTPGAKEAMAAQADSSSSTHRQALRYWSKQQSS